MGWLSKRFENSFIKIYEDGTTEKVYDGYIVSSSSSSSSSEGYSSSSSSSSKSDLSSISSTSSTSSETSETSLTSETTTSEYSWSTEKRRKVALQYRFSGYQLPMISLDSTGDNYVYISKNMTHPYYRNQPSYWHKPYYYSDSNLTVGQRRQTISGRIYKPLDFKQEEGDNTSQ